MHRLLSDDEDHNYQHNIQEIRKPSQARGQAQLVRSRAPAVVRETSLYPRPKEAKRPLTRLGRGSRSFDYFHYFDHGHGELQCQVDLADDTVRIDRLWALAKGANDDDEISQMDKSRHGIFRGHGIASRVFLRCPIPCDQGSHFHPLGGRLAQRCFKAGKADILSHAAASLPCP